MFKKHVLMIVVLSCLLISAVAVASGENLLLNPGFEDAAAGSGTEPYSWKSSVQPGGEAQWSETVARSGERSLMIGAAVGADKWSLWHSFTTSAPPVIIPGKTYRLSGYFKTEGFAEGDEVNARIIWRDQNAKSLDRQTFAIPLADGMDVKLVEKGSFGEEWTVNLGKVQVEEGTGWTYFSVDVVASTLQVQLQGDRVRYYAQVIIGRCVPIGKASLGGTVWFDDISFALVD